MKRILYCLLLSAALYGQETPPPAPAHPNTAQPPTQEPPPPVTTPSIFEAEFWKFRKWAGIGYRRDRQQFNEFTPANSHNLNSRIQVTNRNSIQLIVGSHMEYKSWVLHARGCYGWLLSGFFDYDSPGNYGGEPLYFNGYSLGAGYTADALAGLGPHISLYDHPDFGFSFVPSVAYCYMHMMNFPEDSRRFTFPNPSSILAPGTTGFAISRFPDPNQQDWFGPYLEGRLEFRFGEFAELNFFYQCHFAELRMKVKNQTDIYEFDSLGAMTLTQLTQTSSVLRATSLNKQLGGVDMKIHKASGWTFALHFEAFSLWEHDAEYRIKRTIEQFIQTPTGTTVSRFTDRASVFWVNYQASLFMGYKF